MPDRYRVPYRALARSGLVAVALFGLLAATDALGQPAGEGSNHPGNAAAQTEAKPQGSAPEAPIAVIQKAINRIAKALEAQNAQASSQPERERARQNLKAQKDTATWAGRMFWVGFGEATVTLIGVILVGFTLHATRRAATAAESAVAETRRIGEAQVRAYVSISGAQIQFRSDWVPGEAFPTVSINAGNSGQSPARDFMWRPTIQYISGSERRQRDLGGAWVESPGISISANESVPSRVLIADMGIVRFAATNISPSGDVLVRVRIEFSYSDVFGKTTTDEAYFTGSTRLRGRDAQKNEWAPINLNPLPAIRDWDNAHHFHDQ